MITDKSEFLRELKKFAATLKFKISRDGEWNIRGFVDIFKNVYPVSSDTKVVSKILELHLFPHFLQFAEDICFQLELAEHQNWYPDLTFISKINPAVKFAVDLKTTYRDGKNPDFCNGFTLGSHGEYFTDRTSKKNIQYPYSEYSGHFCVGIIYSREDRNFLDETRRYSVDEVDKIPAVLKNFIFFAEEKWKIASDNQGSGNTANIGSIKYIKDILTGRGVFSIAGEELFDEYWANFGKLEVPNGKGAFKKLSTFEEFLKFKGLSPELKFPKRSKNAKVDSHE